MGGELSETFAFGLTQEQQWPAVLEQLALRAGKPMWLLEKTPLHLFTASRLLANFPTSKCICLIRDGRDVVASLAKRSYSIQAATQRWTAAAREILLLRSTFPSRTMVLHYEALVGNPNRELMQIAYFLAISGSPLQKAARSTSNIRYLGHKINASLDLKSIHSLEQIDERFPHNLRRAMQASLPLSKPVRRGWLQLSQEQKSAAGENDDFRFYIKLFGYSPWSLDNLDMFTEEM